MLYIGIDDFCYELNLKFCRQRESIIRGTKKKTLISFGWVWHLNGYSELKWISGADIHRLWSVVRKRFSEIYNRIYPPLFYLPNSKKESTYLWITKPKRVITFYHYSIGIFYQNENGDKISIREGEHMHELLKDPKKLHPRKRLDFKIIDETKLKFYCYDGIMRDNLPNGVGYACYPGDIYYYGGWKNGKFHGIGILMSLKEFSFEGLSFSVRNLSKVPVEKYTRVHTIRVWNKISIQS